MNKSAIIGLLVAIVIPISGYFIVKHYGEAAVHMPHRYFFDSVAVTQKNGKIVTDTLWHQVHDMNFTNQLGKKVTLEQLKGKIIVVDFFFSRCPSICPLMAHNMKRLQNSFVNSNDSIVQFVSVSIDPEHDSVPQLRKYANRYTSNHDSWWFVTGNKKDIYEFALGEMKASVADVHVDTAFIHTENMFLLDKNRVIRGWYNGLDTTRLATLVRDIPLLMLEKNKKRTFGEFLNELFGRG